MAKAKSKKKDKKVATLFCNEWCSIPLPKLVNPKKPIGSFNENQIKGYIWHSMSTFGFAKVLWWCIWAYFFEYLPKRKEYKKKRQKWLKYLENIHD